MLVRSVHTSRVLSRGTERLLMLASLCTLLLFAAPAARAQLMINKGATIVTKPSSIVKVNGAYQNYTGSIDDSGTVTVTTDFTNNSSATAGGAGLYYIGGNFTNDGTWVKQTGTVDLNGSSNQYVGGAVITTFYNLRFTGGGRKTLTQKEIVDSNCYFTNGVCYTTQTNVLNFDTQGNWVNNSGMPSAGNISYVDGPVEKDFNRAYEFQFPIGKLGRANTASITTSSSTATTYRMEYFYTLPPFTNSLISPLVSVSKIHYWHADILTPSSGGANSQIKLYWIAGDYAVPSMMMSPSNLVVARLNIPLSAWESRGASAISPGASYVSGWVQSPTLASSLYGSSSTNQPFTLGSLTTDNTLPVELSSFTVQQEGNHVRLNWKTSAEIESAGFEVERRHEYGPSAQIKSYLTDPALQAKSPWGASYTTIDDAMLASGEYRYDLYEVDQNGTRTHVGTRTLNYTPVTIPAAADLAVYPNPVAESAHLELQLPGDAHVVARVYDMTGKLLVSLLDFDLTAGSHLLSLDASQLANGTYTLVVYAGSERLVRTLIVRR